MIDAVASVEVSNPAEAGRATGKLPPGCETFIPWLPKSTPEEIVAAARTLRGCGFRPVPHVAARRLPSEAAARALLERLKAECDVDSVLVIGGDVGEPRGPFASSFDLLRSGILQSCAFRAVGFGAYPEGHPSISIEMLESALDAKLAWAKVNGIEAFVVSQFCFDGKAISRWIGRLRSRGIGVPIRVGLAGPASAAKLLRLGLHCGVGNSLRVLRGRLGGMARLATRYTPDDVLKDLEAPLPGAVSLHLFAFGGIAATAQWLENFSLSTTHN